MEEEGDVCGLAQCVCGQWQPLALLFLTTEALSRHGALLTLALPVKWGDWGNLEG